MKKIKCSKIFIFIFLVLIAVIMLTPFVWLIISSLRPNMELLSNPFSIPETIGLQNYRGVFHAENFY